MVVPLDVRCIAAALGAALVLAAWVSIIQTLIVPRPAGSRLPRLVNRVVLSAYRLAARNLKDLHLRDRALATQPAATLLTQLVTWLVTLLAGFTLLLRCPARRPRSARCARAGHAPAGSSWGA
jgi:hypothetical protein